MNRKVVSIVYLNAAILLWSGTAMFAKGVTLPLSHITFWRYVWGAVLLLVFLLILRRPLRLKRKRDYAVAALTGGLLSLNAITIFQSHFDYKIGSFSIISAAAPIFPTITPFV